MAYNQSTGSLRVGDLLNEDDNDTSIDWDSDKIQFKTNNTLRFIVDNTGCGIGVASPETLLHIQSGSAGTIATTAGAVLTLESSEKPKIHFQSPNAYGGAIVFGSVADNDEGQIDYDHGSDRFLFKTGGNTKMAILGDNVGIGISDPDQKLEVSGAIHISAELGGSDIPSTPAANDGGVLYAKEDGKLYYKSNTVSETDISSGGGGGSESPNLVTAGYLKVSGSSTLGDATADVVSIVGQLTASQGATLGDASSDKVIINAATVTVPNLPSATDNTVLVVNSSNNIGTDEINAKVWDSKLIENTGTPLNNQVATFTGTTTLAGESNLIFDGSKLQITGRLSASANINSVGPITTANNINASGSATIKGVGRVSGSFRASGSVVLADRASVDTTLYSEDIKLVNVPAGTDNSVLIRDPNGMMRTDEIDSRVWGTTLVDVSGVAKSLQIPIFADANTITGSNVVRWVGAQTTLAVTGAIRSQGQLHITHHAYNTTATTDKFLPFYNLSEANAPNNATYINQIVVPFGGQVKRVLFRASGSQGGLCVAKIFKATTPTQKINKNDSGVYVATSTVTIAAGPARTGIFVFTGSNHYNAGDAVGISIDPHANPVEVNATCVWEYNVLGV